MVCWLHWEQKAQARCPSSKRTWLAVGISMKAVMWFISSAGPSLLPPFPPTPSLNSSGLSSSCLAEMVFWHPTELKWTAPMFGRKGERQMRDTKESTQERSDYTPWKQRTEMNMNRKEHVFLQYHLSWKSPMFYTEKSHPPQTSNEATPGPGQNRHKKIDQYWLSACTDTWYSHPSHASMFYK